MKVTVALGMNSLAQVGVACTGSGPSCGKDDRARAISLPSCCTLPSTLCSALAGEPRPTVLTCSVTFCSYLFHGAWHTLPWILFISTHLFSSILLNGKLLESGGYATYHRAVRVAL